MITLHIISNKEQGLEGFENDRYVKVEAGGSYEGNFENRIFYSDSDNPLEKVKLGGTFKNCIFNLKLKGEESSVSGDFIDCTCASLKMSGVPFNPTVINSKNQISKEYIEDPGIKIPELTSENIFFSREIEEPIYNPESPWINYTLVEIPASGDKKIKLMAVVIFNSDQGIKAEVGLDGEKMRVGIGMIPLCNYDLGEGVILQGNVIYTPNEESWRTDSNGLINHCSDLLYNMRLNVEHTSFKPTGEQTLILDPIRPVSIDGSEGLGKLIQMF
ncbi:MAG: hypothetical protein GF347_01490 [Candidatus Moranbacteria bacterium]|nr:hypothetical protein [Candidatus Moranbacteria bacterium]